MDKKPAPIPDVRLVAIDLDGTLLTDSKKVTQRTVDTLCALPDRGVKVVIASARPPRSVRFVYEGLKLDTLQINYNGALIWDEGDKRPVFHLPLAGAMGRRIVEAAHDLSEEVEIGYEVLDRWYTNRRDERFVTDTTRRFTHHNVTPLEEFIDLEPTKLDMRAEPAIIANIERRLTEQFGSDIILYRLADFHLQMMDKRVSKATALGRVARHYGIDMRQVMAIGDAPNDVAMLQTAGISVAMDNAHPRVKEVADWIAPSNNDHGVCEALRQYGLCE